MNDLALTAYVLVWPVLAAGVLLVLCVAVARDMRRASREGEGLV
ncbi:MAG: putative transporter small subunit [Gammaproteobacteria bacterium]